MGLLEKPTDLLNFLLKIIGIFPAQTAISTWVMTSVSE